MEERSYVLHEVKGHPAELVDSSRVKAYGLGDHDKMMTHLLSPDLKESAGALELLNSSFRNPSSLVRGVGNDVHSVLLEFLKDTNAKELWPEALKALAAMCSIREGRLAISKSKIIKHLVAFVKSSDNRVVEAALQALCNLVCDSKDGRYLKIALGAGAIDSMLHALDLQMDPAMHYDNGIIVLVCRFLFSSLHDSRVYDPTAAKMAFFATLLQEGTALVRLTVSRLVSRLCLQPAGALLGVDAELVKVLATDILQDRTVAMDVKQHASAALVCLTTIEPGKRMAFEAHAGEVCTSLLLCGHRWTVANCMQVLTNLAAVREEHRDVLQEAVPVLESFLGDARLEAHARTALEAIQWAP